MEKRYLKTQEAAGRKCLKCPMLCKKPQLS